MFIQLVVSYHFPIHLVGKVCNKLENLSIIFKPYYYIFDNNIDAEHYPTQF